jgi:hypothetical protein
MLALPGARRSTKFLSILMISTGTVRRRLRGIASTEIVKGNPKAFGPQGLNGPLNETITIADMDGLGHLDDEVLERHAFRSKCGDEDLIDRAATHVG